MRGRAKRFLPIVVVMLLAGCSPKDLEPPKVNAKEAAAKAMEQYDKNKDGVLDSEELKQCPALLSCLPSGNSKLSKDEIEARIAAYSASGIGLMQYSCEVTQNGATVAGATVTLTPEAFLGPNFKPASGVTDSNGIAILAIAGEKLPGLPCGLYQVSISKKDNTGRETLPDNYNTKSAWGVEIMDDPKRDKNRLRFPPSGS